MTTNSIFKNFDNKNLSHLTIINQWLENNEKALLNLNILENYLCEDEYIKEQLEYEYFITSKEQWVKIIDEDLKQNGINSPYFNTFINRCLDSANEYDYLEINPDSFEHINVLKQWQVFSYLFEIFDNNDCINLLNNINDQYPQLESDIIDQLTPDYHHEKGM